MEALVLGCTIMKAMGREADGCSAQPEYDALGDSVAVTWTVLGAVIVAVLSGCAFG